MSTYSEYWPFFEHVQVINLDARVDRWEAMQASFARFGISGAQRFSAVSPALEVVSSPALQALYAFLRRVDGDSPQLANKVRGTWGCLQSHLAVIRKAKEAGWPYVLILEDDGEFEPFALPVMQRVDEQLHGHPWDLLYLGGTFKKGGRRSRYSANLLSATRIRLTHAYVVNHRIFDHILGEAAGSGLPLDWYYSEILQPQVQTFLITPTLVNQRLYDVSDIEAQTRKPKVKFRKTLVRAWNRLRYWRRLS